MINYNPKNWLGFIFSLHKSDTIRILWKEIIYIAILTAIITSLELHFFPSSSVLKNLTAVYSLLGFVISLLLVFRTNTAYDRWWEGRKLWGAVVNDSRNLSSFI
jgi:putative membrane protein